MVKAGWSCFVPFRGVPSKSDRLRKRIGDDEAIAWT